MLRRVAIVSFAIAALLVVACGHQVTPSPNTNNLSGHVVIKFDTVGQLDFTDFTYAIIIDTCGTSPGTPYPQAFTSGSLFAFSYGFFIGGKFGTALPQLVEYFVNPNSNGTIQSVDVPENPSLEQLQLDDNGQGNEFELIFDRAELDNPLNQAQPCPLLSPLPVSPSPSSSAGSSPTATPTSSASGRIFLATATPVASPTAAPSTAPVGPPTTSAQQYWYFNFFTIQNTTILDSLGIGGATDTTFNGVGMETNTTQDYPIFKTTINSQVTNPSAQLEGGNIQNYE
jgi:hypothetical protein